MKNHRKIHHEVLLILAVILNYTAFNMSYFVWKPELIYFIASVFIASLTAGCVFQEPRKVVVYLPLSMFLSIMLALAFLELPPLALGQSAHVDFIFLVLAFFVQIWTFGGMIACVLGGIIGALLAEEFIS